MRKFQVVLLILGFAMVLVSHSEILKAGKPVDNNPHPDGIFDDQSQYKIRGDGEQSFDPLDVFVTFSPNTLFANGLDGVSNTIWVSNGGGDYVQGLGGNNAQRRLIYDFEPAPEGCPTSLPAGVTCDQPISLTDHQDDGGLNVRRIGFLELYGGGAELTTHGAAGFYTALGQVRFGNIENVSGGPDPYGSSSLNITELVTDQVWEVSTKPYPDDIATLVRTVKGKTKVNRYHMPFRMIIDARP